MSLRVLRIALWAALTASALVCLQRVEAQSAMRARLVASTLGNPVGASAPVADFNRLFIVVQGSSGTGSIRILDLTQSPPALLAVPYLSVSPILAGGEQGLLGLAFHPDFANNGYFFVFYTNPAGNNQVVRYRATAPYLTSTSADPASATQVMTISHPGAGNHNGGALAFGPDGYLYIGVGDGGTGFDPQDLAVRAGKVLRIDIDGDDFPSDPSNNYAIPATNPFSGSTTALPEIWHTGVRNPWRLSFDRVDGDLWIGDVGAAAFEEVDFVPAGLGGLNLGWSCMEGLSCTGGGICTCNDSSLTLPVHVYPHTSGNCCIIGGYRYRGLALCGFQGLYFFGDFCSGRVWTFEWNGSSIQNLTDRTAELAAGGGPAITQITSFAEDAAGEIYICDGWGDVFRIEPDTITDCNQNGIDDNCDLSNGTSHDWNFDGIPDECQPVGTPGCFGDGTGVNPCPCGNTGQVGRGCENSASTGGARLEGAGQTALDNVVLVSSGELLHPLTIFLQGDRLAPNGIAFGDGLRCAAGTLRRLYAKGASGGIACAPAAGDLSITARSTALGDPLFPTSGQVRYYQAYYRDASLAFCPAPQGNTWNVSSMLTVTW